MDTSFSRRDFMKGSVVLAMGAVGAYALSGCSPKAKTVDSGTQSSAATTASSDGGKVTLHRGYGAAHGESCFTQVVVATAEDGTIYAASIDDYQFVAKGSAGITAVPNSDSDFAQGYAEGMILMSKSDNDTGYSDMMKAKAQPTQSWLTSMKAVEAYCVGKKATDLTDASLDAVSGATLTDTPNYLKLVSKIAQNNDIVAEGSYSGNGSDLKLGRTNTTAHGTKEFCDAISLVQNGDTLIATSIDGFQFFDSTTAGLSPVPNSDKKFGQNYASGVALASKSVNSGIYSEMMKSKANATTPWLSSMTAIEQAIAGQKISSISIDGPDAVSGATLVDTANYVKAAVAAAKLA